MATAAPATAPRERPATPSSRNDSRIQVQTRDLIALRHPAQGLVLRATRIRAVQGHNYLSPFKGRGMEFDESRPYQAGDDIRSLDWRVTARTGKPHTKLFREERERPVILAVDYRPAMFFATRGCFKSVLAAQTAALLAWRASQQGDRLGGLIFSALEHWEIRPRLGSAATLHFLEQLARRSKPPQTQQAPTPADALNQALARLRRVTRPGSLLVLISDFRELTDIGQAHLAQLARHNEVILIFLYDPLEQQLPVAGRYRFSDTQREVVLDTGDRALQQHYAQRFSQRQSAVQTLAQRHRMRYLSIATEQDPLQQLQQGLLIRQT